MIGHLPTFLLYAQPPSHQQYFPLTVVFVMVSEVKEAALKIRKRQVLSEALSSICTFICQDQLLVLAVFLSCPLERGGSQLGRGARGYALSPLCGETHGGLERLSAGAERKSEREHTWGGWFIYLFSSQKSGLFLEGPFRCRDICCREDRFTGGTLYWREGKGP